MLPTLADIARAAGAEVYGIVVKLEETGWRHMIRFYSIKHSDFEKEIDTAIEERGRIITEMVHRYVDTLLEKEKVDYTEIESGIGKFTEWLLENLPGWVALRDYAMVYVEKMRRIYRGGVLATKLAPATELSLDHGAVAVLWSLHDLSQSHEVHILYIEYGVNQLEVVIAVYPGRGLVDARDMPPLGYAMLFAERGLLRIVKEDEDAGLHAWVVVNNAARCLRPSDVEYLKSILKPKLPCDEPVASGWLGSEYAVVCAPS